MAAASNSLRYSFKRLLYGRDIGYYLSARVSELNMFSKYLEIPITKEIEYPIFVKEEMDSMLNDILSENEEVRFNIEKVIVPIYSTSAIGRYKTADIMIRHFFDCSYRLSVCNNGKGEFFFGGPGIILDADFNILFLLSFKVALQGDKWVLQRPIVRVDNSVFVDQQKFMNKAIIQKLLPLCLEPVRIGVDSQNNNFVQELRIPYCDIIVQDCKTLLTSPKEPSVNIDMNKELNQTLVDNVNEIMSF